MTSKLQPGPVALVTDIGLVLAAMVIGLLLHRPGVFIVDESHYLLACEALASGEGFSIHNGYEQVQDPSLLFFYTVVPDHLQQRGTIATVPPYHAILALPWIALGGLRGLMLLNMCAFGLTLVAVRRLAAGTGATGRQALFATAAFGLATYSLEYSIGIWPHALSQALVAWCTLLLLRATGGRRHAAWIALAAGLLGGVATGVRLQNIVMLPVIVLAGHACLRLGGRIVLAHLAGWCLPLVGYALVNLQRLGTLNPFTYGAASSWTSSKYGKLLSLLIAHPWILAVVAVAGGTSWWLWRRTRRRVVWYGLGLAAVTAIVAAPATRELLVRWMISSGFHLFDTSVVPGGHHSTGAHLNELGQVLYNGVLKKGLFEAVPWLALVTVVAVGRVRRKEDPGVRYLAFAGLAGLLLLPAVLGRGGLSFNPRYFLELLPLLCVAACSFAHRLGSAPWTWAAGAALGMLVALPAMLHPGRVGDPGGGLWSMLAPLTFSFLLASAAVLGRILSAMRRVSRGVAGVLLAAGMTYACLVHLRVDLAASLAARDITARMLEEGHHAVPPAPARSVLLVWQARKDVFSPLKIERDIWIGDASQMRRADWPVTGVPPGRRVFVLVNGMPRQLLDRWTRARAVRREERSGLVFLELVEDGPD